MKTKYKITIIIALLIFGEPSEAHAHGEDAIVSIGIQLLLVIAFSIYILFIKAPFYRRLIYSNLIIISGVIAWLIKADIPYYPNKALINTILWGCPMLSFGLILMLNKFLKATRGGT
jgi:hypothetical protein